jgi:hypothetical protein
MIIPSYIPINLINHNYIKHEWDDWDPYEIIGLPDEETKAELNKVTYKAMLIFTLGCAEWAIFRFNKLIPEDDLAYQYLEAFWVYLMDVKKALPPETTDEDKWEGPIYGPINMALATFYSSIHISEYGLPLDNSALSERISLHVLIDKIPFLKWKNQILKRLIIYCELSKKERNEDVIPREILDPDISIDTIFVNRSHLVKKQIESIDFKSNRFLKKL